MTCQACNNPKAYIGFVTVECPNRECRHFCESMAPKPGYLVALDRAIESIHAIPGGIITYYNLPPLPIMVTP